MNQDMFILSPHERPSWVEYPKSYRRIIELSFIHITPWHILEGKRAVVQFHGLSQRYPSRQLFPFAYLQTCDDVACWARGHGEKVFIIHDFASPGWEGSEVFDDVWSWFRAVIEEMIIWDD